MNLYFKGKEQSLQNILIARDRRVEYQAYLLEKFKNTVISYKLNIPGPIKYNSLTRDIFDEGLRNLGEKIKASFIEVIHEKVTYEDTGAEYFGCFNEEADIMKEIAVSIEEEHPLGRLFDFDVLNEYGIQISRQDMGIEARKCLLCEKNAFECGRSRKHEIKDLIRKIESMHKAYFKECIRDND